MSYPLLMFVTRSHLFSAFLAWQYSLSTTSAVMCLLLALLELRPSAERLSV